MDIIHKGTHIKDCFAVKEVHTGNWKTAWGVIRTEFADLIGEKNRNKEWVHWMVLGCNNPSCKAELWIKDEFIYNMLPKE